MTLFVAALVAATALSAESALAAQSAPARLSRPADSSQRVAPPSFPSDTQVVVLDVVATGDKGRAVDDLRADELQVSENGRPCEVLSLRLVRAGRSAESGSSTAPARDGRPPGSLPNAEPTPARASLVVLVFDRLTVESAPLARKGALSLLEGPYPADTWFAVFKVRYGVHLLASFTTDQAVVRRAIERATGGDTDGAGRTFEPALPPVTLAPPGRFGIPDLRAVASGLSGPESAQAEAVAGLDSIPALSGIAQALQQVQGRKAMVYFAEAFQLDPFALRAAWVDLVSAANRANVAVHTVDARGLTVVRPTPLTSADSALAEMNAASRAPAIRGGPPGMEAGGAGSSGTGGDAPGLVGIGGREAQLRAMTLQRLADETGGLAIDNTNDLGAGLARVAQELRHYYEVVYAPADPVLDGRFRQIHLKLTRPGVRLRTRVGYFATPRGAPSLSPHELPLMAALAQPDPPDDLKLRADALHFAPKGADRECVLLAEVPLAQVEMVDDEAAARFRAHLSLLGYVKDESGGVVARLTHDWPIEGPLGERDAARAQPAVFRTAMTLPAGRYTLEVAVQDRNGASTSVARKPFDVPAAGPGLSLGSIAVLRGTSPAGAARSEAPSPADDPLRVGETALRPALGVPFVLGSGPALPVYVPVYPGPLAEAVELSLELRRGAETVGVWTDRLSGPDTAGRIPWLAGIPAASLRPGPHELVATVRRGLEVAEERASVEIVAAPAAPEASAPRAPAAGAAGSAPAALAPASTPSDPALARTLLRAARYVEEYEERFRNVVAEEEYSQEAKVSQDAAVDPASVGAGQSWKEWTTYERRRTRADLVFVRLAGDVPWGLFRDVFEANGQPVRDRDERLAKLFQQPSPAALEQAQRILQESARYNIGSSRARGRGARYRTLNVPTLPLVFLAARNQQRFAFELGRERRVADVPTVEVRFLEVARPTFVQDASGGDLPATGRFWIDPQHGTVLRSELEFRFEPALATASIETEYRREPTLRLYVPSEMKERYEDLRGGKRPVFGSPTHAEARYSNFRQFTVTTDETAKLPEELR